jgi:hypothetical protein
MLGRRDMLIIEQESGQVYTGASLETECKTFYLIGNYLQSAMLASNNDQRNNSRNS